MKQKGEADWIINRLSELHPSFYPLPGVQVFDEKGKVVAVEPNTRPYLTKVDLLRLYRECGGVLHRGTLKSIMADSAKHMDFARIAMWAAKITQLLDHHQIPLIGGHHQIWVIMQGQDDGHVHYAVMEDVTGEAHR